MSKELKSNSTNYSVATHTMIDLDTYNQKVWELMKGYLDESTLIKHQIDTFNDFMLRKLEETIDGFNPIEINNQYMPENDAFRLNLSVVVKNPVMSKPTIHEKDGSTKIMTPNDARLRNFTYAAPLSVDVDITFRTYDEATGTVRTDSKKLHGINLGKVPIMVRSKYCVLSTNFDTSNMNECRYDPGGYFVINGNEKVVISQDRISENKTFVFTNTKAGTAYSHLAEIRSVSESRFGVPKTTSLKLSAKTNHFGRYIRINVHHIKHDVPLFVIFKALGIESDRHILDYILYDTNDPANEVIMKELVGSIDEASEIVCARDALEYLSKYLHINGYPREMILNKHHRLNILRSVLETEFLPHVGTDLKKKALYLGYMTKKLVMCYLGLWSMDDRDSYINKRVDSPGVLMANLFRQYYGKMVKDMKNMVQKEMNNGAWKATGQFANVINKVNIYKIVKSTVIESGLKYALATGNWGVKSNKNKQGVAQVLNRLTFNASLSHMRRVNTPLEKSGKLVQPRKLHNTQFGYICPAECFDPKTPILMWNGTIKEAQDVIVGDYLIDDNGNAVRVKSTCEGVKAMYEIVPKKRNFMSHTVTDNHILTLKVRNYIWNHKDKKEIMWFDKNELRNRRTWYHNDNDNEDELNAFRSSLDDDDVIDITIETYLSLPENVRKNLYLFKSAGINWEHKEVALDPYILGMWLGDGFSCGFGFATADMELRDKWIEWGKDNDATITKGIRYAYTIGSTINKTQSGINCNKSEAAPLKKLLAKYGLVKNKHIPLDYLVNDRTTRLAVLAGLVDTDGNVRANGHEIRICQGEKNYKIIHDAEFLAQSLGFSCYMSDGVCTYSVNGEKRQKPYKELRITGEKLYEIPTVLPRKKLNKFDIPLSARKCSSFMQSSFELLEKEEQPYVGWQLEGSGRFLLGDMSTSHNTPEGGGVGLVKNLSMLTGVTIASNSANIRAILIDLGVLYFVEGQNIEVFRKNATKVIVNGDILGVHDDPTTLYTTLKGYKRSGVVNVYTSVVWNVQKNELQINTEGGRCVRPLFVVQPGQTDFEFPVGSWKELVIGGHIEFLDVEESNTSMIAMSHLDLAKGDKGSSKRPNYTHLEIHPSLILGVLAGNIPFSNHNQAPRNCYQCLDPSTTVLMADGSRKMIADVGVGDTVITFDPKTMYPSTTKVIHQYVRPTENTIYEIETVSGRKIVATGNHNFMTPNGWVAVENFRENTQIGILMHPTFVHPVSTTYHTPSLKQTLADMGVHTMVPLGHLPILSRIVGYMWGSAAADFADFVDFADFAEDMDRQAFEDDIATLGFKGFKGFVGGIRRSSTSIPEWIVKGGDRVVAEFLASFQGRHGFSIDIPHGERSECWTPTPDGIAMTTMFESLGIEMEASNGDGFQLRRTDANMEMYFDRIGYCYCNEKARNSGLAVEFLKIKRLHAVLDSEFDLWKTFILARNTSLFVPIESIKRMPNTMISDITVAHENHSFIAGDNFLSSNSSMGKQAIGIYASNFRHRFDTMAHVLNYPQKPIVETNISKLVCTDEMPCGVNVIVAIACMTGFNQEDSVIMNKSAVDRGLFTSTYYRTYKEQNNRNHSNGEEEFFVKPSNDNTRVLRPFNYDKLEQDGFVKENTFVDSGDIIIGKCMPQKVDSTIVYKDTSIALKNNEVGFVDRNCYDDKYFTNVNGDGYTFCKVRIRNSRVPSIGDKFSCYSPDHDVLTLEHGWVPIDQITKDHQVATLVDDHLVYQHPAETQSYDYAGKMYRLETNQVDLLVTPNHRMYVSMRTAKDNYKMVLAEDLYGKSRLYSKNVRVWEPAVQNIPEFIYGGGEPTHFKLGTRSLPIEPWLTFLGVWFAEGSSCPTHGYVSIAAHKPRVKEALLPAIQALDIKLNMQRDQKGDQELNAWRIYDKELFKFMLEMTPTKSVNKKLPQWVFALPRRLTQILLDGMLLGDGHTMTNGTERYDTSSLHLRDQFQQLCLHAGHSANASLKYKAGRQSTKQNGYVITSTADAWRLTVVTSQNSPLVNKTVQQDSWVDYDGKVYCCTVPRGHGVIFVRRNGKVVWSGNSRHGQKGTIGMLYSQEDMPFTKDGIVPDIIVNPHAIPSRMTIAQLMECLLGKACTGLGTYGDATPFTELSVEDIAKVLQGEGMERYGNEIMYNSRTGEQIATEVFIGPTFYQRLKHMTCDKVHSRSNAGPIVLLTRQPSEGRAREGGLRIGEMEQEVHIAHGIQSFLKERFMESADNYRLFVCKKCGFMAVANPEANIFMCKPCKNTTHFREIRIPYAAKLLFQEMQTMSIGTRFITKAN